MDMTTASVGMMIACVALALLLVAFLVIGILAGIKYLRAPQAPQISADAASHMGTR